MNELTEEQRKASVKWLQKRSMEPITPEPIGDALLKSIYDNAWNAISIDGTFDVSEDLRQLIKYEIKRLNAEIKERKAHVKTLLKAKAYYE